VIGQWIGEAARASGQSLLPLSPLEVDALVHSIRSRYVYDARRSAFLWESFRNGFAARIPDGWSIACSYPELEPILLFLDGDSYAAYRFASSTDLQRILAESPVFEFYVTNAGASFVLCFNHHDFLIGVGSCVDWLRQVTP
jgi:hypothetical protein